MSAYPTDGNGTPVQALQPIPGLHREFSLPNTEWTTIPIEGGALVIRIKVSADCFVVIAPSHHVPTASEMRISSDVLEQFGVSKDQVLHIRAHAATSADSVSVKMTPLRAAS